MAQKEEEEPPAPPSPSLLVMSKDSQVEEQLHHMQEKLRLKDAEVEGPKWSQNFMHLLERKITVHF